MLDNGIITRRTKGFYYLTLEDGSDIECKVKGQLFKDSRYDNQIAVGDIVTFIKKSSDNVGLITGIKERKSFLSRVRIGIEVEQVIAANVDHLLIVAATKTPPFRTNLVNRLLVAAKVGNVAPVIVLTKTDLVTPDIIKQLIEPYKTVGVPIIQCSVKNQFPDTELNALLGNKISVLAGQSGVGKSSLLNRLFPDLQIKVGAVSQKTAKGSHTTTYAVMHKLTNNGFVIDTPGIREFGLWGVNRDNLGQYYPLIEDYIYQCKHRNCHHVHEPMCAVKAAAEKKIIHNSLYQGYLSIYDSLEE